MGFLRDYAKSVSGLVAIIVVIVGAGVFMQQQLDVGALQQRIERLGMLAPVLFIAIAILKNILFLPVLPMVAIIGLGTLLFGVAYGVLYSWVGMTAGSCLAFVVARYGAGTMVARFKVGNLQSLDEVLSAHGFLSILGLRLVVFSNTALNYLGGLTSITFRDYALGTLLGLVPRTVVVAAVVETLQEPNIWEALLSYPKLLWFSFLIASWVGGVWLLGCVAKDWARVVRHTDVGGRAIQTMSALIAGKLQSKERP